MNLNQKLSLIVKLVVICLLASGVTKAAVIYVDTGNTATQDGQSWQTAFKYLQDALTVAGIGDEIHVAQGVYKPDESLASPDGTGEPNNVFGLVDGIILQGGYAGLGSEDPDSRDIITYETVLSGDLAGNDTELTNSSQLLNDPNRSENSYHVISTANSTSNLILDGFTISGGIAVGPEPHFNGGAIRMVSSSPTINNCRFEYNAAANGGALYNLSSSPVLTNCVFFRNYAQDAGGCLRNITSSNPILSNCKFIENKASGFGGAIANSSNSSPSVMQCTFSYNWSNQGGAINNYDFCDPTIVQSMFLYNTTDSNGGAVSNQNHSDAELLNCGLFSNASPYGAGLYNYQSNPRMVNCVASGNIAVESGGVLYNRDAIDVNIINCTFVGNTAAVQGALLYNVLSNSTLQNCILWDNIDPGQAPIFIESGTPTINYSCIQGGWIGGTGNIDANPMFIDPNGPDGVIGTTDDNFRLLAESLCIDAGDNTVLPADDTDLDNDGNVLERIPLDYIGKARFINIPDVFDTGLADMPTYPDVIDMGAMERSKPILVDILAPGPGHDGTVWSKAFNHLQDALAIAEKGDHILVAQGIYCPDPNKTDPTVTFDLIDGVVLKGGYGGWSQADPNVRDIVTYSTILSGDLLGNDTSVTDAAQMFSDPSRSDNSYHIIIADNVSERTELNGFTITGGMAVGTSPHNTGGGIRMVSSNPTISNCSFEYNVAEYGGAVYNSSSNPVFTICNFFRNYADNHGGGLRNYEFSSPELSDCTFTENKASGYGGVIANSSNSSPIVMQCNFSYNWANQGGGAINNYGDCSPQITQTIFEYNTTNNNGGALRNENNSNTESINCEFTNNDAVSGGAVYNNLCDLTVTDCNFIDNTTTDNGGAIFSTNSSLSIQTSSFMTNQTGNYGGALYNIASSPLYVDDCIFLTNTALSGGAIYNDSSIQTVTDSDFIDNGTTENGGAIFSTNSSLSVQASTFTTNQSGGYGGALYNVTSSPLNVTDCGFTSNTSTRGGAIYCENSVPTITGSTFLNNATTDSIGEIDENGGAIFNDSENLSIIQSLFQNNESYVNGGAVYCINGDLSVENSVIRDNQSGKNGGGIYNITANAVNLTSCIFSSNTAVYDGGGAYIQNITDVDMVNCLITHNNADYGGGIANTGTSTTDIIHCTLSENTAGIGQGIYNSGANAVIQNSIVLDSVIPNASASIDYSCVPNWTGPGIGNITTQAPDFVNPQGQDGVPGTEDDNFRLSPNSPCLDVADNTAIPAGLEEDLDQRARVVDADCSGSVIADMGAYEFSYLLLGDFNLSCSIDLTDFIELASAWLTTEGDTNYNSACDISISSDHSIDGLDLEILYQNWLVGVE